LTNWCEKNTPIDLMKIQKRIQQLQNNKMWIAKQLSIDLLKNDDIVILAFINFLNRMIW
jgi:hypothetical protein